MVARSRFTSIVFMRILAVRKREGGQILEIFFRPAIAVVNCFSVGTHFVEDHDCQTQTFLRWKFYDTCVVEVFCREFHGRSLTESARNRKIFIWSNAATAAAEILCFLCLFVA